MLRRRGRLAVHIGAQQREVEAPARELEVVGVAAERGASSRARRRAARRRSAGIDRAGAAVERHSLTFPKGLLEVREAFALHSSCVSVWRRRSLASRSETRIASCTLSLEPLEHVGDLGRAVDLGLVGAGHEAKVEETLASSFGRGNRRHSGGSSRSGRSARRTTGAARQPNGAEPHALEPGVVDADAVALADEVGRKVVEGLHAFVGRGGARG